MKKKTIFVTGAAGYVGTMLIDQLITRDDVGTVVCLDMKPQAQSDAHSHSASSKIAAVISSACK